MRFFMSPSQPRGTALPGSSHAHRAAASAAFSSWFCQECQLRPTPLVIRDALDDGPHACDRCSHVAALRIDPGGAPFEGELRQLPAT
jgi:hypothetical protein